MTVPRRKGAKYCINLKKKERKVLEGDTTDAFVSDTFAWVLRDGVVMHMRHNDGASKSVAVTSHLGI